MPPKRRRRRADEVDWGARRRKEEGKNWWEGKPRELMLRCFEKELALLLKLFFTDAESLPRRRASYFRRNYFEVPKLREQVEGRLEDLNRMLDPRVEEALSTGGEEKISLAVLEPHMLRLEEARGYLKLQWPAFWASLGERADSRRASGASEIRAALSDWWYEDIRAFVIMAEQELSGPQMSRLLFDCLDDHFEVKVTGLGRSMSFVLPEFAGLEVLAEIVQERLQSRAREDGATSAGTTQGSWLFKITDGVRKSRAEKLLKRVLQLESGQLENADEKKQSMLLSVQESASRGGGDVHCLKRLIEVKAELGLIPESEASSIEKERDRCLPFVRVASRNEEPECEDGTQVQFFGIATVGSLPAPEDEPILAHWETNRTQVELEFLDGDDKPCKVEVVSRVPRGWRRPYSLVHHLEGPPEEEEPLDET